MVASIYSRELSRVRAGTTEEEAPLQDGEWPQLDLSCIAGSCAVLDPGLLARRWKKFTAQGKD